jgi:hypothetical protein
MGNLAELRGTRLLRVRDVSAEAAILLPEVRNRASELAALLTDTILFVCALTLMLWVVGCGLWVVGCGSAVGGVTIFCYFAALRSSCHIPAKMRAPRRHFLQNHAKPLERSTA